MMTMRVFLAHPDGSECLYEHDSLPVATEEAARSLGRALGQRVLARMTPQLAAAAGLCGG